jgi:hypothetical protein
MRNSLTKNIPKIYRKNQHISNQRKHSKIATSILQQSRLVEMKVDWSYEALQNYRRKLCKIKLENNCHSLVNLNIHIQY